MGPSEYKKMATPSNRNANESSRREEKTAKCPSLEFNIPKLRRISTATGSAVTERQIPMMIELTEFKPQRNEVAAAIKKGTAKGKSANLQPFLEAASLRPFRSICKPAEKVTIRVA